MKSLLTVSGVVFAHICVFLLLVNGCRGNPTAANDWANGDTSIYSGGARRGSAPASAVPAPASAEPAKAVPASAEPQPSAAKRAPASAAPAESAPAGQSAASASAARTDEVVYEVKKGEYLSTIAVRYGVTAKDIADANGIALSSTLKVGQKLKIPAPKQKPAAAENAPAADGEIYVVQKGDILGKIARKYKVSVAQIKKANGLKNDNIRVGQKLVIPLKTEKKAESAKTEEKADAAPAPAPEAPKASDAASEPAAQPEKSVPAETEATVPADDNFGMPEGGFRTLGGEEEAASAAQPEEAVPASGEPAASEPAAGTPAR